MSFEIAFFVSSILSAYWNGAATYYRGLASALSARGHRLSFFEPDAFGRQEHRDFDELPWGEVVVYDPHDHADVRRCLRQAAGADFVVKASGVGVLDARLEAEVALLRGPGRIFWDVDTPATLARLEADERDSLRALLPEYDFVFCYGGGDPARERYRALGARRCEVIYNALDPRTHHPVPPEERFRADLGFLGNRLPDRERRVEEFLFEPARRLPHCSFVLGGAGWEDKVRELPNLRCLGHVFTGEHNAFNVSAKAVINISRDDMARMGWSPATRLFEAAGAGACVISDAWQGMDAFLEPGREVLVAENGDDVVRQLDELDRREAAAIGARARRRMLEEHTYAQRALDVERVLNGAPRRQVRTG
ncbi:MAG TPA: glycosyltransferase [Woeseiaceae bacterium]|nr:glycosyltransferase [Woeseiaceae bacterium]